MPGIHNVSLSRGYYGILQLIDVGLNHSGRHLIVVSGSESVEHIFSGSPKPLLTEAISEVCHPVHVQLKIGQGILQNNPSLYVSVF